jgi:hypothetical protein
MKTRPERPGGGALAACTGRAVRLVGSDFDDALDHFVAVDVAVADALALPSFAIKAVLVETLAPIDWCTGDRA